MDKTTLTNFTKNVRITLTKHSPAILTGIGITGMIGTTVMAVKATPKALQRIEEKKKELHSEKLPVVEVIKATWRCYIPAAVTGFGSAACLIRANSISTRRNAALLTAYNLSKTALDEYKDKVVETIGENKEKAIIDAIAKDKVEKNPVVNNEVIVTDKGPTLCYDALFGRYFTSDIDTIKRAENNLNRIIVSNMYASLNEFYSEIGLSGVDIGDDLGWNLDDGQIEIEFSSQIASDGRPCIVLNYNVLPAYDYHKHW